MENDLGYLQENGLIKYKSFMKWVRKVMLYVSIIISVSIITMVLFLLAKSPGKPKPFLDNKGNVLVGSISEKLHVKINGVEQGMFIKGKDQSKPVLLFLHGGPGMPEYAVSRKYPLVLEECFTVCWWEQRGAGLSFSSEIKLDSMSFEQIISDTIEVTKYLSNRFGQNKIYLMGHSGGSFIGIQVAEKAPELYKAYIGLSQISYQLESERLAYKYMVSEFKRLGDKKMLKKFEKHPISEINTPSYYEMRDAPMHKLGIGTTRNMKSVISGVFLPVMLDEEYTLGEKINIWRGKAFTTKKAKLWCKLVGIDLTKRITRLSIPIYFCAGKYDYTCSYELAKGFFETIDAPVKGFYTFEETAHSPLFEEPQKMKQILMQDVLQGKSNLY